MFMHVTTIVREKYVALCFHSFGQAPGENVCEYLRRFCSRHRNETFAYAMAAKYVRKPGVHISQNEEEEMGKILYMALYQHISLQEHV